MQVLFSIDHMHQTFNAFNWTSGIIPPILHAFNTQALRNTVNPINNPILNCVQHKVYIDECIIEGNSTMELIPTGKSLLILMHSVDDGSDMPDVTSNIAGNSRFN